MRNAKIHVKIAKYFEVAVVDQILDFCVFKMFAPRIIQQKEKSDVIISIF